MSGRPDTPSKFALAYAHWVIRLRYPLLLLVLAGTLAAALHIPDIDLRNDPDTLLPAHNRHVLTNAYVERTFGMSNFVVVGLEAQEGDIFQPWFINLIRRVHQRLEALPHARPDNFISLAAKKARYIQGGPEGLDIRRLIPRTGISEQDPHLAAEQLQTLRQGLNGNDAIRDMLVSPDRKAAFVIADFDDQVKRHYLDWVLQLEAALEAEQDPRVSVYIAGEPYFFALMLVELSQYWYLFAIAVALVGLILFWESRLLRAALLPLAGVGISIVWTLGLMGWSGYRLTTMAILTPVLVFAIGIGHSIQIMRRYLERMRSCGCHRRAAEEAIARTIVPATVAIITDISGFLALATVDISFYRAYSYFGQFGMLSLLLTCTTLVPAMLYLLPPPAPRSRPSPVQRWETRAGSYIANCIAGPLKWRPILIAGLLLGVSAAYFPDIERGINFAEAAFKPGSEPIKDLQHLNRTTPGVISFNIPFIGNQEGALRDPALLEGMARMEDTLRADPDIGFTFSFAQYIRLLNRHLHEDDPTYWTIPEDPDLLEQLIFIYEFGADPEDFNTVVDYDYTNGQLVGYINTLDPARVHRVTQKILDYIAIHADDEAFRDVAIGVAATPDGPPGIGGFAGTTEAALEIAERNWLSNPLLTAAMVAVITALLFRSVAMALLILIMVLTTLMVQYGLAGYFSAIANWGGNLHFGNLVTLSIAMGLGVDYSIYLAWRFRNEYNAGEDLTAALANTLSTTGSAVVLSVLVLLCSLIPLTVTDLANTWGLAVYIGIAVLMSVFTAITLLPILLRAAVNLPTHLYQSSNLLNLQVSERTLQLRKEKEQLSDALEMLRQTQAQLVESEKMASLGGLVAGVAHEINTPVGNALTVASHMEEETCDLKRVYAAKRMKRSDLIDYLRGAEEACRMLTGNLQRAAALVQSFKQVAVDQTSEERRRFPVHAYLDEVILSLRPKLKKTRIRVQVDCPEDLEIESYPGALAQVISNLIINALIHAYDKDDIGTLEIQVSRPSDALRNLYPFPDNKDGTRIVNPDHEPILIRFRDDGKGIPPEHMDKLFEPFFTTRRGDGGSGLGLHVVYNLVTRTLHGEISCHSELGTGTEFLMQFPADGLVADPGSSSERETPTGTRSPSDRTVRH